MKHHRPHVAYIKMPEYMIPLLTEKFGMPITFQEGSLFYKILVRNIDYYDDMNVSYSRVSCSERAYNISLAKSKGQLDISDYPGTPHPSTLSQYVPVLLPAHIFQSSELGIKVSVPVSSYHVISATGAQRLRESLRQLFWTDCREYCESFATFDLRPDESPTHKNRLLAFLRRHNISLDHLETVNRTDTRLQNERK